MRLADQLDQARQPTQPYRDCYGACRQAGGSISECQARCADLMPGEVGSTSLFRNFVTGFTVPSAPEVGAVFAPVQRTLWLVLAAIGAALLLTRR